jgi:phosphate:Na+ symporter
MALLNLASAIVLILLGMRQLRKGLDRLFGSRLVEWLQKTAQQPLKAFFAGIVAGLISPSSSAIAMLSVQMLTQSALTASRMLAVLLGANIGLTVTVQLLTFDLQDFAGVFIVIGGIGFLFLQRAFFKGAGQVLLGLGFIFLAMSIIAQTGKLAVANADMRVLFSVIDHYPWLMFASTALLALALQSSTATIGLGLGLAKGGLVSGITLVPWVLGANLGIGLTMLIAGWASLEGRRLALASILLKTIAGLLILAGGTGLAHYLMNLVPGAIDRNAANLNTFFNVAIGLCALPLLSVISRALAYLIPDQTLEDQEEGSVFLDPLLLQTPSLALSQAAREELRILDHLKLMLKTVWAARSNQARELTAKIENLYERIVSIQEELKEYLGQIGDENLSQKDIDWRFSLLDYAQELAIIATLVKRDLADASARTARSTKGLRPEDAGELEDFLARTFQRMEKATVLLMTQDVRLANTFIQEKEQISEHYRTVRRRHLERLTAGEKPDTSFFDLLNCFRRINSHLTSVAYAIVRSGEGGQNGPHATGADPDEAWLNSDDAAAHRKAFAPA